jgi:membrane-associated phospholipid phosphatase
MSRQPTPMRDSPATARVLLALCALSLCLLLGFAYLGREVREPDTTRADQRLLGRVVEQTHAWPLDLPKTISLFGTVPLIILATAAVGAPLAWSGRWPGTALLIAATLGAVLLSAVTKHLVGRTRPTAFFRTSATGYSFPSGHALNATCFALALGFVLWRLPWRCAAKIAGSLGLAFYVACVGASRLVLGVHYPTDVLGGVLLGVAWMALLMALFRGAERRWAARRILPDGSGAAPSAQSSPDSAV